LKKKIKKIGTIPNFRNFPKNLVWHRLFYLLRKTSNPNLCMTVAYRTIQFVWTIQIHLFVLYRYDMQLIFVRSYISQSRSVCLCMSFCLMRPNASVYASRIYRKLINWIGTIGHCHIFRPVVHLDAEVKVVKVRRIKVRRRGGVRWNRLIRTCTHKQTLNWWWRWFTLFNIFVSIFRMKSQYHNNYDRKMFIFTVSILFCLCCINYG